MSLQWSKADHDGGFLEIQSTYNAISIGTFRVDYEYKIEYQ